MHPCFATRFKAKRTKNNPAWAANRSVIEHLGEKTVRGHRVDDTGRMIKIAVVFEAMAVKEPILSTNALKQRQISTIFDPDGGRLVLSR